MPFLRGPFGASVTVIHRIRSKSGPSLGSMERTANDLLRPPETPISSNSNGNSYSNSNTASSGKSSGPTNGTRGTGRTGGTGTTGQTSFDSKGESILGDKKNAASATTTAALVHGKEPESTTPVPDSNLTTIQETAIDLISPTVLTVERAAAAKVFLETYFNEQFSKPSPRSLRRRYLEGELYHSAGLTEAEKAARRRAFYRQETKHLRETRVLKAKSIGAVQGRHNQLTENYEVLKILGKGSFGVVRLVREKASPGDIGRGARRDRPVYAMKVIRKSAMLRTSQEAHLRAERDFLVASEGSKWFVSF